MIELSAGHRRESLSVYAFYKLVGLAFLIGLTICGMFWHLDEAAGRRSPDDVPLHSLLIPLKAYPWPVGYESMSVLYVERFFEDGAR